VTLRFPPQSTHAPLATVEEPARARSFTIPPRGRGDVGFSQDSASLINAVSLLWFRSEIASPRDVVYWRPTATGYEAHMPTTAPVQPASLPESLAAGVPPVSPADMGVYQMRMARTPADLQLAQALRFEVFNLELHEGLQGSYATGLDSDQFDTVCDHLLVEDHQTGRIVGTYRMQTGRAAAKELGYYSAQEFDFAPYEPVRGEVIELGRACVHKDHRNFAVLNLLWKGIARYARGHDARYLIGCSSLTSQEPAEGAALYHSFQRHLAPEHLRTRPLPACACPLDRVTSPAPKAPKLLSAYLMVGAKICGAPAIDREFKTIDFLTLLDLQSLPARVADRFLG
jgi:putative hemolysin